MPQAQARGKGRHFCETQALIAQGKQERGRKTRSAIARVTEIGTDLPTSIGARVILGWGVRAMGKIERFSLGDTH